MFVREGAKVVVADVLQREGRQVADAIGASARFEPLDVTKEDSWAAVVAAATRHFGKLDVLVNNAGISGSAEQDFYSTEAWQLRRGEARVQDLWRPYERRFPMWWDRGFESAFLQRRVITEPVLARGLPTK